VQDAFATSNLPYLFGLSSVSKRQSAHKFPRVIRGWMDIFRLSRIVAKPFEHRTVQSAFFPGTFRWRSQDSISPLRVTKTPNCQI